MEDENILEANITTTAELEQTKMETPQRGTIRETGENLIKEEEETEVESLRSRSSSVPIDQMRDEERKDETQSKTSENLADSFESPETESDRKKLISTALQQEDEFLEYLMSLPAASSGAKEKPKEPSPTQPLLMRSMSSYGGNVSSGGGAKVGLDHLDNLCKLMEQLGDLREQNSKLQKRVQYLEDLKNLQEMHKQLQEESKQRELQQVALLQTLQQHREFSAKRHQHRRLVEASFPTPSSMEKGEGFEDSPANTSINNKRTDKCKSMTNGKLRQSLLRYQQRERSRSVGVDEIKQDKHFEDKTGHDADERTKHRTQPSKQKRRSVVGITSGTKAKVSKWTKVKEAFRWEKASVVMLPEAKSQDSGIGGISGGCASIEDSRYLRVPSSDSKSGENLLSVSPVDSVLSGLSSACSSGGQSPGYLPCQHPLSDFNLPPVTTLSSSSSSEDLDIDLTFTDILVEYGPQRSASATDSTGGRLLVQDTRRRSLSQMPEEEDASRRSKSLDGDSIIGNSAFIARHFASKDGVGNTGKHSHQKSHKTPWGKVKDIIQTRKDSLKKRHRQGKTDSGNKGSHEAAPSDHDEEPTLGEHPRDSPDKEGEPTGTKISTPKPRIEISGDSASLKTSSNKRQQSKISTASLDGYLQASDSSPTNRRLTPVLTITLPSTEELRIPATSASSPTDQVPVRSRSTSSKPPPSPQSEERLHKISTASAPACSGTSRSHHGGNSSSDQQVSADDANKCDSLKRQVSLSRPTSASAGTSPPVNRRASKWTKVKKAFLTSSAPGRRDDDGTARISSSVPSSPNRNSSFFDEMDTDELSSGEYGDLSTSKARQEDGGEPENSVQPREVSGQSTSIQTEIRRNYEELQHKLSQEFHKKLHEWERMKATSSTSSSGGRGVGGDDGFLHHDKGFRRKMEEWERMKHHQQSHGGNTKHRDSVALQQLDEDNLSPDFRKKLQEWQRIKKSLPAGTSPQSTGENFAGGSAVPPQLKKKIAEWQLWRSGGSGKSEGQHRAEDQGEEFLRKQQEWKGASSSPSPETVTAQSGQDSNERASGTKTPSPGVVRKDSTGQSKGNTKKSIATSKSSGAIPATDSLAPSKDKQDGIMGAKSTYAASKMHQKGKSQKEKELQWLEKELHKVEREKQRLEREREKYLEREARLEKMRRAMGSGAREQEVLIQTSTGFFRFQGISEKFTRRLYEWEKARGIGPEASTFALLDPGYRPSADGNSSSHGACSDNMEGNLLSRSKSASSVTNLGTGVTNVGTSSLSLNDVEVLEQADASTLEDSRAASEPHLRTTDGGEEIPEDDEPAAVIVDVEDVIEETAAPLPVTPVVQSQTPVYCYAPEEVTRLIDSSGSDSERDSSKLVQRNDSVRTESSYKLLEENMSLLNKLKLKEDICRKLENEIENLEGKIDDVCKIRKKELQRLRREETDLQVHSEGEQSATEATDGAHEGLVTELRARIRELEQRQERLLREGETLQDSFAEHSEQQAALAQNLVGKMKQLQEANINMASCDQSEPMQQSISSHPGHQVDAVTLVHDLSTELLSLAEKLEVALADRSREVHNLRSELQDRRRMQRRLRAGQHWFSEEGMSVSMGSLAEPDVAADIRETSAILPRQSSEELTQLPSLLTNKVLELKEGLNYLCAVSGTPTPDNQPTKDPGSEQITNDAETSATYILKFGKNSDVTNDCKKVDDDKEQVEHLPSAVVQVDSEGNTSPVTCVTIMPAFWKRRERSLNSQEKESSQLDDQSQIRSTTFADNTDKDVRGGSQTKDVSNNRHSYCSAVSSASTTSSVCEDDADDDDDDGDSYASDAEGKQERIPAVMGNDNGRNKNEDENEGSVNDSDHNKSSDDEATEDGDGDDDDDDEDDDDEEDAKTTMKCESDSDSLRVRYQGNDAVLEKQGYMDSVREHSPGYYETEVKKYKVEGVCTGRQRKLLKTRRISDTHVGYRNEVGCKNIPQDDMRKCDNEDSSCNNTKTGGGNSSRDNRRKETEPLLTECFLKNSGYDLMGERECTDGQGGELKSTMPNSIIPESTKRLCYPFSRAERFSNADEACSSSYSRKQLTESGGCRPMPTPDNVFVKTTRKIFSPVRRDSKGKASSVISYVVGETTIPLESETAHSLSSAEQIVRSPVTSNIVRKERNENSPNENIRDIQTIGRNGNNNMTTPAWMITRTRSQSSSPALIRRKLPTAVDLSLNETKITADSNTLPQIQNKSANEHSRADSEEVKSLNLSPIHSNLQNVNVLNDSEQNYESNNNTRKEHDQSENQVNVKKDTAITKETSTESNKSEKRDVLSSSRPATPVASFPPLPQSPNPNRRDLFKVVSKETAPSIRMMIAKYNQKLTEQEGAGGRSPEVGGSGSASPVAWRSPVAERRVRAQMEKYQEEVQRMLQQGRSKISTGRSEGGEVQKSASAGVIRSPYCVSEMKSEGELESDNKDTVLNKSPSLLAQRRGILKSSSAGTIKPFSSVLLTPVTEHAKKTAEKIKENELPAESTKTSPVNLSVTTTTNKPPSPRMNNSPNPSSPSSPEIGLHHSSPPPSRLRALRLQRAKEEFLTRGPGGRSWSSEVGTPSTGTASASVSPDPFWESVPCAGKDKDIGPELRQMNPNKENPSRLSQISMGSESSYDGSVVLPGDSKRKSSLENEEGLLLVKSASAGMINVDPHTYRKFYNERGAVDLPSISSSQQGKSKSQQCSKFGISSIASRFRRVKMRKSKEKESGKMNTVSTLCRQSLLVDLHLSKGGSSRGEADTSGPSTSKSCPSSPVLQRSSSGEKPGGSGTSSTPTSWIFNPARRIFKPK